MEVDLKRARVEIDAIDDELARLFRRRLEVVAALAKWKRSKGVALHDEAREREIVERAVSANGPEHEAATRRFFASVLALCQEDLKTK